MKVLNICKDDWANFMWDNVMALRSVGVDAEGWKQNKHISNYRGECNILPDAHEYSEFIRKKIQEADVVQLFHSDHSFLPLCKKYNKRTIVYHTGTTYRTQAEINNNCFNDYVEKSVIALPEFAGLGAKNEIYMVGAIDINFIRPSLTPIQRPYVISHYPSSFIVKGSATINKLMEHVAGKDGLHFYNFSDDRVPNSVQLLRMSQCDIYIELFAPLNNGFKYGSFGITALEAAAMGKIVVTQNLCQDVYFKAYGECALQLVETEKDFLIRMNQLVFAPKERIKQLQEETRQWVVDKHSYKATGEYILKHIL